MPRHDRVTALLMQRDNGATLPEDVDLCLIEIERLHRALSSIAKARQIGRLGHVEPIEDFITRVKAIAADARN